MRYLKSEQFLMYIISMHGGWLNKMCGFNTIKVAEVEIKDKHKSWRDTHKLLVRDLSVRRACRVQVRGEWLT